MKVIAVNGSPRQKGWNTVTMLESVLEGARTAGADTELIQLYGLEFSGCLSCFSCKKLDRREDGFCAVQDDLTPILAMIRETCDALVLGTPVYYGCETAAARAFLERLCYPNTKYDKERTSLFPRRIPTGLIYTMNVKQEALADYGYEAQFEKTRSLLERMLGPCELLLSTGTMQYSDYAKYESGIFDPEARIKRHNEVFPQDCERARELGARMGGEIGNG